ncbi:MAG: long-chain fatty acid--CoA ligase [Anaerolineae bacterium]|nr:long-chain fatty acid--CoA ligase [Anaerolineae bacterium]MDW8173233.1 long-chain fatty acid--CoA ligase [Anaerolineae bacterium]
MTVSTVTYADRPWTKKYDPHVPKTLAPFPEKVMFDYLREAAQRYPNNKALVTTVKLPVLGRVDSSITYRTLDTLSDAMAAALVDLGLKKGGRVALIMPNCAAFAVAYFATLKAGGIVAATNPTYPPDKLQYQINDCGAEIVVTLTPFYNALKSVQAKTKVRRVIATNIKEYFPWVAKTLFTLAREKKDGHRIELQDGDLWFQDVLARYAGRRPNVTVMPDDVALFQYTGGTTGVSKGAMGTHRALVANTIMLQHWTGIVSGNFKGVPCDQISYLGAIPMFHAYGLVALLTMATAAGGTIILVPNPRDIDEVVDVIGHYQPRAFLGVPALFNAVNNHPRVQSGEVSLRSFVLNSSGSAPLPTSTQQEFERLSGNPIIEGFGMSETPVATHNNPIYGERRPRSIGLPLPEIDARIVSLDDGVTEVPIGEIGELVIAGPNIMRGYHGMPTETANVLREHDGKIWLYTGDIARMDEDGYFYLVDRKKDMALIGGFNVYPANVENVIKEHEAVFEVGVAAIPHPEKMGQEALKAWVVLKPGAQLSEAELVAHCEEKLAPYEVPRRIAFIKELPKTAVGKTLRRELIRMEVEGS